MKNELPRTGRHPRSQMGQGILGVVLFGVQIPFILCYFVHMSSNKKDDTTRSVENEILKDRKFSMSEAIGRAGAGNLKGASPVPLSKQALMDLQDLIEDRLVDSEGSLSGTLVQRLKANLPLLDKHRDQPVEALRELLQNLLASQSALDTLVRDTDSRWGRDYQERPRFNIPGRPDAPDDPYTPDSVRLSLQNLLKLI